MKYEEKKEIKISIRNFDNVSRAELLRMLTITEDQIIKLPRALLVLY